MALVVNDRVRETSTTTGTGTLSLAGAVTGFETFVAGIGNSNTTYYAISNQANGEFEVGLGTVTDATPDTLARTTIISSSNSDSAVDFSAGTKDVFCTLPASKAVILDASGNIVANNGSNLTALNASNISSGTLNNARLPATISDKTINAARPLTVKGDGSSADGQLILNCSQNSHGVKITSPAHSAGASWEWILPTNDGTSGQVLTTDGNSQAQLTWTTPTTADITAVTAGDGLTGGGTTGDVTLNVGAGNLIDVQADQIDVDLSELTTSTSDADGDFFAVVDAANAQKKLTKGNIAISGFNNDSGFIDGSSLNASNLDSGTVPNARLSSIPNGSLANSAITINGSSTSLGGSINVGDITGVTAGTLLDGGGTSGAVTLNVDLSELSTSTSDGDGDFFAVVDASNNQKKLTKGNIAISGFNNDSGFTTNTGTVTSVGLSPGTGLDAGSAVTGSGTISIDLDLSELTDMTATMTGSDEFIVLDSSAERRKAASEIGLSIFNNDAGFTTNTGDITSVVAGSGLTGGATSGAATLNIGAGTGIDVAADAISVDVSDFMANGSNNRIVTATGADGQNAEANLTFDGSELDVSGTLKADKGYVPEATLTDGSTINWDMSDESVCKVTLAGNRTMAAPSNGSTGQFASITVIQDGTGSRTLTWNATYEFAADTAPTLTTTASKADLFVFRYNGSKWLEVGRNQELTVS